VFPALSEGGQDAHVDHGENEFDTPALVQQLTGDFIKHL